MEGEGGVVGYLDDTTACELSLDLCVACQMWVIHRPVPSMFDTPNPTLLSTLDYEMRWCVTCVSGRVLL